MANSTHYCLSQEQVLYILRCLGLPDLPGMGSQPWGHIPQGSVLPVLETAGRSLVAQGLVQVKDMQVIVNERLSHLFKLIAYPIQMTVLTYACENETINRYYYRGNDGDVEHTLPHPWIHEFSAVSISDMGKGLVLELVKGAKTGKASKVFTMLQVELDAIRQEAIKDKGSATRKLTTYGLTYTLARQFAGALASPQVKLLLQAVYRVQGEVSQNVISILSEATSCWLLSAGGPVNEQVQVMAMDGPRLNQAILAAFKSFQKGQVK